MSVVESQQLEAEQLQRALERIYARVRRSRYIQLLLLSLLVYAITINHAVGSGPDGLTLAIQYMFLRYHMLSLGQTPVLNDVSDTVWFAGRLGFVPGIEYGYAFLLLPLAAFGYALDSSWSVFSPMSYLDHFGTALISSLLVAELYRHLRILGVSDRASTFASLAMAFTTTLWPASVLIYYNSLGALGVLEVALGSYEILHGVEEWYQPYLSTAAGFAAAFSDSASIAPIATTAVVAIILAALVAGVDVWRRLLAAASAALPLAAFAAAQMRLDIALYGLATPFSFTLNTFNIGNRSTFVLSAGPIAQHFVDYLFSPYRGLLFYAPAALLGLGYAVVMRGLKLLRIVTLAAFLADVLVASAWRFWDGGVFFGPRFLVDTVPLLVVFTALLYERYESRSQTVRDLLLLSAVSGWFINAVGVMGLAEPEQAPGNWFGLANPGSFYPFYYDLLHVADGDGVNWMLMAAHGGVAGTVIMMLVLLALTLVPIYMLLRR